MTFIQPTGVEMQIAEDYVNRPSVVGAHASCEWDELGEDGQVWIAALIREARRENGVAIRWANQSVEMLQAAFFPLADALRNLETYLRDTLHHNAPEAAAARKALAKFDNGAVAPAPVSTFSADAASDNTSRLPIAQAIAKNCYAFGGVAVEGSERYDCGDWAEMGRLAQLVYLTTADDVLSEIARLGGDEV